MRKIKKIVEIKQIDCEKGNDIVRNKKGTSNRY